METTSEKVKLREQMREKLAMLTAAEARARSATVWERLTALPQFANATSLLIYISRGNEIATHGLIQQLLAMGKRVCVPSFDHARQQYVASELRDFETELATGKYGILEPRPEFVRSMAAAKLEALVVPGLAFDATGNRLGRGLGFFDRLLRGAQGARIALAYDFQILKTVPAQSHDQRVDFLITETRLIVVQKESTP
jgi:5-formyltetrahydrofolate cyclo-ligase